MSYQKQNKLRKNDSKPKITNKRHFKWISKTFFNSVILKDHPEFSQEGVNADE
ncbi:MAG: hypothetical protein ACW981_04620 [Candidatus Hodarchaeales archaeon]